VSGGRFDRCLRFTLREEGGYSNDPADKGKETWRGVTAATFDRARKAGVVPRDCVTVRDLKPEHVEAVFWNFYWNASKAHEFPAPLDLLLFDAYVNHRPEVAVKLIQAAVGADQDGKVGPKTLEAARVVQPVTAIERYTYEREQFYRRLVKQDESQAKFLRGWLNRVARVKASALAEVA
jgi:lysozyme family protein